MDNRCVKLLMSVWLAACSSDLPVSTPPLPIEAERNFLVLALSDYRTGKLAEWDLKQGKLRYEVPAHSDAVVRLSADNKKAVVINRMGADNLQLVDRETGTIEFQFSVGRSSNPQDLVSMVSGQNWLATFESNQLSLVEKYSVAPAVDLTAYADGDGSAEVSRLAAINDLLWVQLGCLDRNQKLSPTTNSKIAVVDPVGLKVVNTIAVVPPNPVTDFKRDAAGNVYVGFAGKFAELDGAIFRFDASGQKTGEVVIEESALGGDIVDFEITASGGAAIVSAPQSRLVHFDPSTRAVRVAESKGAYTLQQLLYDKASGTLFLADRDKMNPSIRVLNEKLEENVAQRIPLSLPPYQMVFGP